MHIFHQKLYINNTICQNIYINANNILVLSCSHINVYHQYVIIADKKAANIDCFIDFNI